MDIWLYPPAASSTDIILSRGPRSVAVLDPNVSSGGGGGGWRRRKRIRVPGDEPPVAVGLYDALTDRYGQRTGEEVWSKMLVGRQGPFAEGKKYDPDKKRVAKKLENAGLGELLEE